MSATNHHLYNARCKTKNHWHFIDAHFQNGAITVLLSLLPIKTAITLIIPNHYQITLQLPNLNDEKWLTLCWHSFSWWGNEDFTHCFAWKRLPIHCIWNITTDQHLHNPGCKAKNLWRSVDHHFQNGAVTVSLAVLPIQPANVSVMLNIDQITVQLPRLWDQKSLTRCWRSFHWIVWSISVAINNCTNNYSNLFVAFQQDWVSAL